MILSLTLLNGPGILPENAVCKHNLPCHLQMPTKALSYKRKPYVNMVQKRHGPEAPTGYDGASGPCSHMASFLYDRALVGI